MNKNFATMTVSRAVDTILDRGAEKLYDKYLEQKLPFHTYERNDDQFQNNLKILSVQYSQHEKMEVVATKAVQNIPIDSLAVKRISVKRISQQASTLKANDTTIDKSTKYQTIIQSQNTIHQHANRSKDIEDSMLMEDSFKRSPLFVRTDRPSTMQVGRSKAKDDSNAFGELKIEEIEQKRAATCHVRKRKSFATIQAEKKRFINIREELPLHIQQEIESANGLRKEKIVRNEQQAQTDRAHIHEQARIRMKQLRAREDFQSLKKSLKGKGKFNPSITNFENDNGEIVINGKHKIPQTHIIHLQFNPEDTQTLSTIEPKHSNVNPTKTKSFFSTKLKKKLKMSDEEFTNNGSRQISSIPFVALNYGIVITQDGLSATASRRRPSNEQTREKYTEEQQVHFKSHIPIVNTARVNIFSTLDPNQTARSSFIEHPNSLEKQIETTLQSKNEMQRSLLWNPRGRSESKGIRISNRELLQREMLQSKLALAQ